MAVAVGRRRNDFIALAFQEAGQMAHISSILVQVVYLNGLHGYTTGIGTDIHDHWTSREFFQQDIDIVEV